MKATKTRKRRKRKKTRRKVSSAEPRAFPYPMLTDFQPPRRRRNAKPGPALPSPSEGAGNMKTTRKDPWKTKRRRTKKTATTMARKMTRPRVPMSQQLKRVLQLPRDRRPLPRTLKRMIRVVFHGSSHLKCFA
jgi:hypothetical protein